MAQDLDRSKLIRILKQLKLPNGQYTIIGGACLVIHGLRKGDDIDMFVTKRLYNELLKRGWDEQWPRKGDPPMLEAVVEGIAVHVFYNWQKREKWQPNVKKIIKEPELIEGFPFMPLELMYEWKSSVNRHKDRKDLELIKAYWQANQK